VAITYAHEYVSGSIPFPRKEGSAATVIATVVNRGSTVEHVRVRAFSGHELLWDTAVTYPEDYQSQVHPHSNWGRQTQLPPISDVCDLYWIQILTTSSNLVPSAGDPTVPGNSLRFPYLGSGDFEHFVHDDGIQVPVGPLKPID
jgi:hypothetical protein